MSKTCGRKSDDTTTKSIIELWPRVYWCQCTYGHHKAVALWPQLWSAASIVKAADWSCGHKVVGACRGGNSRTCWWTPAVRDAVKLKEFYRTFLAFGTPNAAGRCTGRSSGAQLWLNLGFGRSNVVLVQAVDQWTSSTPSAGSLRVHGSLPNQSTCALWTWRRHSTVSLWESCGGFTGSTGYRTP